MLGFASLVDNRWYKNHVAMCVATYMHAYTYMWICTVYMASYICIHARNCMHICASAHLWIYVGVCVIFMPICMFLHICMCMCIMLIKLYVYVRMHNRWSGYHIAYIFCDMLTSYYYVGVCV